MQGCESGGIVRCCPWHERIQVPRQKERKSCALAGVVKDAAGNVLYTDPTQSQVFTITSNNGQYAVPLPAPAGEPNCSLIGERACCLGLFTFVFMRGTVDLGCPHSHSRLRGADFS
jgi:hypothetical protein